MLRMFKLCCWTGIPTSTKSDYIFDPRVAAVGSTKFRSEGTQNLISKDEWTTIHEEMLEAGGSDARAARYFYAATWTFAFICLIWWIV